MSNLSNAKVFGGIGAILSLVGAFVPAFGSIVSTIGLVLVFVAVKYIADETKDRPIFKNYMLFFLCNIIALVAAVAIFFAIAGLSIISTIQSLSNLTNPSEIMDAIAPLLTGCVVAILVGWILLIIGALYLRKSYNRIAEHTNVGLFKTTGLVYFIGAITTIIVIGIFIMVIAKILEIIAFFSLPDKIPSKGASTDSGRRCPNCGRSIPEDARACPYCAKRFEDYL